jgi:alpha-mannosidase
MSHGVGAVWHGSGAEYSWKGVCGCASLYPNLDDREREVYNWVGPDGSSLLVKWNSLHNLTNNTEE